jgi:hypothetical protein
MPDEKNAPRGAGAAEPLTPPKNDGLKPGETKGTVTKAEDPKQSRSSKSDLKGADLDQARSSGLRGGGVTEAAAEEYKELGVNARLDNRTGNQRPTLPPYLKPQQIDGPEVGHFEEHAEKVRALAEERLATVQGEPLGMKAEGPYGRGPAGRHFADEDEHTRGAIGDHDMDVRQ